MITAAEEMIHGTDTGITGVDEDMYFIGGIYFTLYLSASYISFSLICLSPYS